MTARARFRDIIRVPVWLGNRPTSARTVGFRFVWSMIAPIDVAIEQGIQGLKAQWPGVGTPTALPLIGRSRGILRGLSETDESYAARLLSWLDKWRQAGADEAIARALQEFLPGSPWIRVFRRNGNVLTLMNGIASRTTCTWNWDGTSHPERAEDWWDIFIVIYRPPWAQSPAFGTRSVSMDVGLGHVVTRAEYDATKGLLSQWKSEHTKVRAVIWTSDVTLFDPATPATLPDGNWGAWGNSSGDASRTASSRNITTCRYWEP